MHAGTPHVHRKDKGFVYTNIVEAYRCVCTCILPAIVCVYCKLVGIIKVYIEYTNIFAREFWITG